MIPAGDLKVDDIIFHYQIILPLNRQFKSFTLDQFITFHLTKFANYARKYFHQLNQLFFPRFQKDVKSNLMRGVIWFEERSILMKIHWNCRNSKMA